LPLGKLECKREDKTKINVTNTVRGDTRRNEMPLDKGQ